MLSEESVMFLTSLLDAVQLSGNDPHLVDTANAMARARNELDAAAQQHVGNGKLFEENERLREEIASLREVLGMSSDVHALNSRFESDQDETLVSTHPSESYDSDTETDPAAQ